MLVVCGSAQGQELLIKIPYPVKISSPGYKYFTGLISEAIRYADPSRKVEFRYGQVMEQGRALYELEAGNIDIFWVATSAEREKTLKAVPIPLTRGFLGVRQFIIRKDQQDLFDKVKSLDDLRDLVACQGRYWPDTEILQQAGLAVMTNPVYRNLFEQLRSGRCDYFPRAIYEGPTELRMFGNEYPELMVYRPLILAYPSATYFFTSKNNAVLADMLTLGLQRMVEKGALKDYMRQQKLTSHLFPLSQWQGTRWLSIDNPLAGPSVHPDDKRLWVQPDEFGAKRQSKRLIPSSSN